MHGYLWSTFRNEGLPYAYGITVAACGGHDGDDLQLLASAGRRIRGIEPAHHGLSGADRHRFPGLVRGQCRVGAPQMRAFHGVHGAVFPVVFCIEDAPHGLQGAVVGLALRGAVRGVR